jgi:ElaB/YqjD/DUF883 family membrane-anchored ribosome-binding protein
MDMSVQSERLVADVKILVNDTGELVKATASETGEKVVELRNRVQDAVTNIKPQLAKLETVVVERPRPPSPQQKPIYTKTRGPR